MNCVTLGVKLYKWFTTFPSVNQPALVVSLYQWILVSNVTPWFTGKQWLFWYKILTFYCAILRLFKIDSQHDKTRKSSHSWWLAFSNKIFTISPSSGKWTRNLFPCPNVYIYIMYFCNKTNGKKINIVCKTFVCPSNVVLFIEAWNKWWISL